MVVVAGADMAVATDPVSLLAHHHDDLGVDLQPDNAVGHMNARLLESPSPTDVGLFVEPCLDFDQHRHLYAAFGGVYQCIDDRALPSSAVERELDGSNRPVTAGLANELHHGSAERRIGVVQQDVATGEQIEKVYRLVLRAESRFGYAAPIRPLVRFVVDVGHRVQRGRVQGNRTLVDVACFEVELPHQQLEGLPRHRGGDLEADRTAEAPPPQLDLNGGEQVFSLLSQGQVGVASDPERR